MDEIRLTVRPFRMGTDKEAALKPLEEAAEVYSAWQEYDRWLRLNVAAKYREDELILLANEIADTIQAACNLAARYGIDLAPAMERCEGRNRARGRYEMDGNRTPLDADGRMDAGGDHDCCGQCHETATMTSTCDEDGVGHSTCGRCGRTVGRWYRFCPWCGARFTGEDEASREP